MTRRFLFVVVVSLLAAACGASATVTLDNEVLSESVTADDNGSSGDTSAVDDTDTEARGQQASEQAAPVEATSTPVPEPTATPTPEPEPIIASVELIAARTDAAASGNPTLSWDAAPDAANYRVTVLDETGTPYWAWSGPETEVTPPAGGPVIADGYQWTVIALTADDVLVAASARQTVGG